ncbi:MAG: GTP-binding protein [Chloroflexi bacterium]|nr:GTP-binding protein [Chloroflexota bacterium]
MDDLIRKLPPETQSIFRTLWESLPASERTNLLQFLSSLPNETNLIKLLVKLSTTHLKLAFGQKHRVAIVGPANVGKSTLYNQFISSKADRALVSPVPGTTRANQSADAGLFAVIDTPGADAVGDLGEAEKQRALDAASESDFLIIVFDSIQGVKRTELELYHQLAALGKPYVVVLNKIDLVRKEQKRIVELAAGSLGLKAEQVIPIVAKTGENLGQVLVAVSISEPAIVAAIGQALPQYRWQMAWRTIASAASISAVIALTPLPVIDFAPLVVTQSVMVLGIARIYNYKITLERARELIATFGLGFLGRTLFYELSKFGGIPGWLLAAAIATSTTVVMGYAASVWFEKGQRLSGETLKKMTSEITRYLLDSLRSLGKRKPSREGLRQKISEALERMPAAADRGALDQEEAEDEIILE